MYKIKKKPTAGVKKPPALYNIVEDYTLSGRGQTPRRIAPQEGGQTPPPNMRRPRRSPRRRGSI